jgi:hypothetical protein
MFSPGLGPLSMSPNIEALRAMQNPNIIEALESPKLFGPVVGPLKTWAHWLTFLKALYGLPFISDEDREVFTACTGRAESAAGGYSEAYALVGRRGGKSKIVSLIAAYEAIFGPWSERLSTGEHGNIFVIATDKKQAGICLSYIRSVFNLFPDLVERESAEEIHLKNNISIAVKTCTFRASRGFTTCLVICDELAFWRSEESANPAEEVLNSILPGLMDGAKLLGISTPYGKLGFMWEMHRNYFGKDDSDILIWSASTKMMNPTFSDVTIKRLIARDASVFRAEFEGTFREDIENFLPLELIEAAMTRSPALPDLKNKYVAFCDPSGGRADSMTLAIAHADGDKILLDRIEERKSPFDPVEVVSEFSTLMKGFGISQATSDRFGGIWVEDCFAKKGIRIEFSDLSASEIYLEFLPLMTMGKVELIKNDRLLSQLQNLERRTQSGGRDKVDHPAGLKDDVANSCAGACVFVSRNRQWSLAELEKGAMPMRGEHKAVAPADAAERDLEKEMRDFMSGNKIIK